MRIRFRRVVLTVLLLCGAAPAAAQAAKFPAADCPRYGDLRICTAQVPSFDGTALDADLTLPAGNAPGGGAHPLIVLLHGFSGDKHDWESTNDAADGKDKWHWNSHWFAKRGYYVLSYTARGFRTDQPSQPHQPATPSGSSASLPSGTIQLKSRDAEIRDTQWLAALAAATFKDLDRERVVVSGNSYGGGESWLQSTQPDWTFPHSVDKSLPVLKLKVAVPKYGWTDLSYSLAPHGRGDPYTAATEQAGEQPIGVVKLSYVNGFYALGTTDGIFEAGTRTAPTAAGEGTISVPAWRARLADSGDPYDAAGTEDPIVAQARRGLTEFRSSHYQKLARRPARRGLLDPGLDRRPVPGRRVDARVPRAQGARPALACLARVRRRRPPARAEQGGHVGVAQHQANAFVSANLDVAREGGSTVSSEQTTCDGGTGARVSASGPRALATRAARFALPGGSLAPASGSGDPDGVATDPVAGSLGGTQPENCRKSDTPSWPGRYTALTAPLAAPLADRRARRGADPVHARAGGLRRGRRARLGRRARRHHAAADARRGAAGPARLRRADGRAAARPLRQPLARARRPPAARGPRPGRRADVAPREPAGDAQLQRRGARAAGALTPLRAASFGPRRAPGSPRAVRVLN